MRSTGLKFFCITSIMMSTHMTAAQAQQGIDQINVSGQYVMAAKAGRVERVIALLAEGAKVNSRDRNGDSPLNMAAAKGNIALADVLLKAGADVDLANVAGVTPLMGSAFNGHAGIVRKLLAAGAKISPVDRVTKNAATYAAGSGCSECLSELIKAGTLVNAPLDNNLTLLMWAAAYGQDKTVRLLLAEGADRSLKDNRNKTASDMARDGKHLEVAGMIDQQ